MKEEALGLFHKYSYSRNPTSICCSAWDDEARRGGQLFREKFGIDESENVDTVESSAQVHQLTGRLQKDTINKRKNNELKIQKSHLHFCC